MAWEGNGKVGVGRMTITESKPSELVRLRLDFKQPMQATNMAALYAADGPHLVFGDRP